jgi:outer membrane receptor protein involved in Fe transport
VKVQLYIRVHLADGAFGMVAPINVYHPVYGAAIPTLTPSRDNDVLSQQHGGYLQDQLKFRRQAVFTFGVREDWAITDLADLLAVTSNHQNDSKLSGRAGVTWLTNIGIALLQLLHFFSADDRKYKFRRKALQAVVWEAARSWSEDSAAYLE